MQEKAVSNSEARHATKERAVRSDVYKVNAVFDLVTLKSIATDDADMSRREDLYTPLDMK